MNQPNHRREPSAAPERRALALRASVRGLALALLALLAAGGPAVLAGQAQRTAATQPAPAVLSHIDSLRMSYRLPEPPVGLSLSHNRRNSPGASMGSPSAYGARFGDAFIGVGYQQRTRYTNIRDGSVVVGFGLGDPQHKLGLEIAISSYSTVRSGFGSVGGVSFKLHRLLPHLIGVAIGVENVATWGNTDAGRSIYAVASKVIWLADPKRGYLSGLALSAGLGNGRFMSEPDALAHRQKISPFGGAALRLVGPLSGSVDWTGQDLNVGLSIVPVRKVPIVFSAGFADVTHHAGDGARFIMGIGYGNDFRRRAEADRADAQPDQKRQPERNDDR